MKTFNPDFQRLFNQAYNGVMEQGGRSIKNDHCCYRGEAGRKCAIGHLMSDEMMAKHEITERSSPGNFPYSLFKELAPSTVSFETSEFLFDLRSAHDQSNRLSVDFKKQYMERMQVVADRWKLEMV